MPTPRNKSQAAAQPPIPDELLVLTEEQAARLLGLTKFTLHRMRTKPHLYGAGPRSFRLTARRIGYRRVDLEAWIATKSRSRPPPPRPLNERPAPAAHLRRLPGTVHANSPESAPPPQSDLPEASRAAPKKCDIPG